MEKINPWEGYIMNLYALLIVDWYLGLSTETMLLINWICVAIFLGMAIFFAVLWIRSEKKLAKHGESKLFQVNKKPKDKDK